MTFHDSLRLSVKQYLVATAVFWTLLVSSSLFWGLWLEKKEIQEQATTEARADLNKDLFYRRWAAGHGGVYVPVTEETPPSPYLAHIKERDITTPSGRPLTLVNPAYMTRQVHALAQKEYGVQGHITSLNPLRPENGPDPWERGALQRIAQGESEVIAVESMNGEPYLRVMRMLRAEKPCLKCHAAQGYKEGDIRGGISVSVPMAPYVAIHAAHSHAIVFGHIFLWMVGLAGLLFVGHSFSRQLQQQAELEEARRRDEERLYLTQVSIDSASDCVFWIDEEARFRMVNETACRRLGYSREEFAAMRVFDIDPRFPQEKWAEHWQELRSRGSMVIETVHRARDGAEFPVEVSLNHIAYGDVVYDCAFARDISDRKQAGEAYRRLSDIIERSLNEIYIFDPETLQFKHVNQGALKNLQYTLEEIKKLTPVDIKPEITETSFRAMIQPLLTGEQEMLVFKTVHRRADGSLYPVEVHLQLVGEGKERTFLAVIFDITQHLQAEAEKARLEAQYQQLQKAESLGRMAGAIAHNFNNLLMAVMGNLELAMEKMAPGAGPMAMLTDAMKAARRAAQVSGSMLTYLGHTIGKLEPLDLSEACRQILPMIRVTMPEGMELEDDFPSPGPIIKANAHQIHQVLTNLVTNGGEALGEGGGAIHLAVKTVSPADIPATHRFPVDWQPQDNCYACLEVMDSGCGIAEKDIDALFDPFFTTKFTGRGLGLSVVLGIVRAHGGAVTVEGEAGRGSVFRVFLPVSDEAVSTPAAGDLRSRHGAADRRRADEPQND